MAEYRRVVLSNFVNKDTMADIIKQILKIDYEDSLLAKSLKTFTREPIELYINSGGGSIYDGFALIDTIRHIDTPVHTYCFGRGMSMGLIIFLNGEKRFVGKHSYLLLHEASATYSGDITGIKQEVLHMDKLQEMIDEMIIEKSKVLQSQIDVVTTKRADWYINSKEALQLGICDEII